MDNNEKLDFDPKTLFQPAWTQGKIEENLLKKFGGSGEERPKRHFDDKRRGAFRGGKEQRRDPRDSRRQRPGGNKPGGHKGGGFRGGKPSPATSPRQEVSVPLPEVDVTFIPEAKQVAQLAHQIKTIGRAYPLFQVAQLVLDKPDYYAVKLTAQKSSRSLFLCALDDSAWAKENEAVLHVLRKHLNTFYQAERVPTDPPKGVYNFVAQCGMSGVVLGPPNYHDYQTRLQQLHSERFSQMPFEAFKSRVKIVKDEALLKQWIEEQSFKTEYNCLNVPEPLRLVSLDEVNKHFRSTHKDYIIKRVDSCTIPGTASRNLPCEGLRRLIRRNWEQLKRFPLPFATLLSKQLADQGLHFFKVDKTVTFVNVARPKLLDPAVTPVSDGIKRIVEFIQANKKCNRKKLLSALAPVPRSQSATDTVAASSTAPDKAPAATEQPAVTPPELTAEQKAVMTDLHWLIHQGFVLEFANGRMEAACHPSRGDKKSEQ